jgi:hypothetical protein
MNKASHTTRHSVCGLDFVSRSCLALAGYFTRAARVAGDNPVLYPFNKDPSCGGLRAAAGTCMAAAVAAARGSGAAAASVPVTHVRPAAGLIWPEGDDGGGAGQSAAQVVRPTGARKRVVGWATIFPRRVTPALSAAEDPLQAPRGRVGWGKTAHRRAPTPAAPRDRLSEEANVRAPRGDSGTRGPRAFAAERARPRVRRGSGAKVARAPSGPCRPASLLAPWVLGPVPRSAAAACGGLGRRCVHSSVQCET